MYANYGAQPNVQPVLETLVRYASQEDKQNAVDFLLMAGAGNPKRQANRDWLLRRLKVQVGP